MLRTLKEKNVVWSDFEVYFGAIDWRLFLNCFFFFETLKSVFLTFCNQFLKFSMPLILKRKMAPSLFSVQFEVIRIGCLLQKKGKLLPPKPERSLQTDLSYSLKQIEK